MFGFLNDLAKGVGQIIGAVVGPIVGISISVIASTLKITETMVKEATDAGCTTYEEIRDFFDLD